MTMRWKNRLWACWFPLALVALWETLIRSGILDPLFFSSPSHVAGQLWRMLASGELWLVAGATLVKAAAGFVIGSLAGVMLGVATAVIRPVRLSLEPMIAAVYATPTLSLLPILMLLLGLGVESRIVLIALAGCIIMAMQTQDAIRNVEPQFVEIARNHGAGIGTLLHRVYVPSSLPQIFTGLRLAALRCFVVAVAVELLSGPDGLGLLIWKSWQVFSVDRLFAGVFISGVLGLAIYQGLASMERVSIPWKGRL